MTFRLLCSTLCLVLLAGLAFAPPSAEAQVWKRVKEAAKNTVEREAEEKTEALVEGALEGFENAVVCAVTDEACIERAQNEGKTVVMTDAGGEVIRDESGAPVTDPAAAQARAAGEPAALKPGEGVWANYDFVPGDRVLFADDFADEYVGDFPRRLTYVRGTLEVVEWEGRRLLRGTGGDRFVIQIPDGLPEQYTIEFDIHDPSTSGGTDLYPAALENGAEYAGTHHINIGSWRGSGVWSREPMSTNAIERLEEEVVPIRISVDRGYVKVYAHERRIANVPQVDFPRESTGLTFHLHSRTDRPIYLGNLRVAEGGRTRIYETLSAEGRVVTHGILFDVGSATIRPESTPTLTDIGRTLQQHAPLRLRIEGHTDNTGTPEGNQTLSQQRAESVRAFLMAEYGVSADRLEAVGMGQAVPAAPNDTEEGRQTNRRVELVRL
jgi:outer membrane protein OmpA-like peptidoglycan-associated protein